MSFVPAQSLPSPARPIHIKNEDNSDDLLIGVPSSPVHEPPQPGAGRYERLMATLASLLDTAEPEPEFSPEQHESVKDMIIKVYQKFDPIEEGVLEEGDDKDRK
ncbi:hypothetical protein FRC09_007355 [Ceratobasidium sp. 395]|nr:hypothetical protein FRC09_007355 [Ceratobasidium sp. 395]